MKPVQLFDPTSSTYSYLLFDPDTREALLIDPVREQLERDLAVLREYGLTLLWVVETHAHADHVTSAAQLAEHTGARTAAPADCGIRTAAVQLRDGSTLAFGRQTLRALSTPGHTAGGMSYVWETPAQRHVFTGDTMAWPGHDYADRTHSTIGAEKAANLSSGLRHDAGAQALLRVRPAQGYAGDVSPHQAYQWWQAGEAVLIDVRSDAEREWVGFVPEAVGLAWKQWPGMALNPAFDAGLRAAVPPGKKALLLCRSGVRSIAAAKRATELGVEAYNILEGFEGDPDEHAHRGHKGGWRYHGLPWRQG